MDFNRQLPGFDAATSGRSIESCHRQLLRIRYDTPTWYTIVSLTAHIRELETMARKRSKSVDTSNGKGEFRFLNVSIDESAYEEIMERYQDGDALMDCFQLLMETGYKFSFSLNSQSDMFICSMTDRRPDSGTMGACLTGSADSWYDALKVTLYKHEVVLKSNWATVTDVGMPRRRIS